MTTSLKPGLYLIEDGATTITRWGCGFPRASTWKTGEFVSGDSAFMKRPSRLYIDCTGSVAISVIRDGTEIPIYTTPPTTNRGRPLLLRLPAAASLGKRFAFKFEVTEGSEVHSARIVGE